MKKLSLDDLTVDSFVTSSHSVVRGTVIAFTGIEKLGCNNTTSGEYSAFATCGSAGAGCSNETCDADCTGDGGGTANGITCNVTCIKGATDCGTCAPAASCDLQYGCSGTSFDMQPC
ncbi:pinensin family lanthipeptide [Longimicrobium sp.]|uniref:pinensin family lanthipeptide n=1 Tax=Longimicrobium sp. TaxID=2029185 RepID=UPI002E36D127|nr:pinensin family lanthipeptide [Longimicrobium sp.]HEX6039290.1 pinensin family lanthipeptide [Longimicrobium sp.]